MQKEQTSQAYQHLNKSKWVLDSVIREQRPIRLKLQTRLKTEVPMSVMVDKFKIKWSFEVFIWHVSEDKVISILSALLLQHTVFKKVIHSTQF